MNQIRVLVVEGDSTTQKIEDRLLNDGHRVVIIGSAVIALDYLKRGERFDAVVIGVNPFGMTRPQLLDAIEIESDEKLKGVPIILCESPSP